MSARAANQEKGMCKETSKGERVAAGGLGQLRPPTQGPVQGKGKETTADPKVEAWILGMTKALQEVFAKVGNAPEGVNGKEKLDAFKENVDQLLTNLNPQAVRKTKEQRLQMLERKREATTGRINSLREAAANKKEEYRLLMEKIGSLEKEKGDLKMEIKEVRGELQEEATDSEGEEDNPGYRGAEDEEEDQGGEQEQGAGIPLRREYALDLYQDRKGKKQRTERAQDGDQENMDLL